MNASSSNALHVRFLCILPKIETHARFSFRSEKCQARKADKIAEVVAIAWKWFIRLHEQGKDATQFPTALARLAVRSVRSGRRVAGMNKAKDAMNEWTQRKKGFNVESLPISTRTHHEDLYGNGRGQHLLDAYEERLHDNTQTPPDEQAAFRIDFPDWLKTRTERDRRIINVISQDEKTTKLASMFGISPGRVSQLRREYMEDWARFTDAPLQS